MKTLRILLTSFVITASLLLISLMIISDYQYETKIQSYWELADKASTIEKKSEYIDKFVKALEDSKLNGKYNAIFLTTPDNSFDANLEMLKTLQTRLHEIQLMDIKSFEYQTAIQQITQQEQGEALNMLAIFHSIWLKDNYILLWDWIFIIEILIILVLIASIIFLWLESPL